MDQQTRYTKLCEGRGLLQGAGLTLLCLWLMVGCLRTRGDIKSSSPRPEAGAQAGEAFVAGIEAGQQGAGQQGATDMGGDEAPVAGTPGAGTSAGAEGGVQQSPDEVLLDTLGIQFVQIEGGEFEMGARSYEMDELPIRAVRVSAFELMDTEVTVS